MNTTNAPILNLSSTAADFDTLAVQLTPTALRKPVWLALVKTLLAPIKGIHADYDGFRRMKRRRLKYNGQVRLLENIVNQLMIGDYDMDDPVIYLDEPEPIEEFLVSPDGNWEMQGSIHHDIDGKTEWDNQNHDPEEPPEDYSILHDGTSRVAGLGFEVHLTPPLDPAADDNEARQAYLANGGEPALRGIVDTYKLAGKRYVVIQDEE